MEGYFTKSSKSHFPTHVLASQKMQLFFSNKRLDAKCSIAVFVFLFVIKP